MGLICQINVIFCTFGRDVHLNLVIMIEEMLLPLVSVRFATEPKYREGHIRIINALPGRRILGLHVPDMKRVAKELARRDDAIDIIRGFEQEAAVEACSEYGSRLAYEETVIWGLMINAMKVSWEQRAEMLREFVPVLDNWAVCDTFCCNAKWKCDRKELWDFLLPYWKSHKEFEVRFAIVMSMVHFLDTEWFSVVCGKLDGLSFNKICSLYRKADKADKGTYGQGTVIGESPYYVRMAVAWLLATSLAKLPDETRAYVNASRLPEDVKRLYARKARESFRTRTVSPF